MARYFYDCEFCEAPDKPIVFISIGIVASEEDKPDREYYAVSNEFSETDCNDFVKKNVLPNLGLPENEWKPRKQIAKEIIEFVGKDKNPHLIGYYSAYDYVAFCQLFGRMVDLPKNFPNYAIDIKQIEVELGEPKLPKQKSGEHNALADARYNKIVYEYLMKLKFVGKKLFNLQKLKKLLQKSAV